MQRVHFHVRVDVFNCQQILTKINFFRYLCHRGEKQIECGLAWSVLLSTTIRVITVVKICCETISFRHIDKARDGHSQNLSSRYNRLAGGDYSGI